MIEKSHSMIGSHITQHRIMMVNELKQTNPALNIIGNEMKYVDSMLESLLDLNKISENGRNIYE